MKVVVTGATGFVGRALCADLRRRGHDVVEVTRASHGPIESIRDWTPIVAGADVVFHLAAHVHVLDAAVAKDMARFREVNVAATERLLRACRNIERFVFMSSIKVYGRGETFTEDDPPDPAGAYGISKVEGEAVVRAGGVPYTIIRPPLVYGPGVKAKFLQLLGIVRRGIPLPFARVTSRRSMIYLRNLTDALIVAATSPGARNETFLVADDEALTTAELVRELAALFGRPARLLPFPQSILQRVGKLEPLVTPFVADTARLRARTGWRPPFTAREGLAATVAWYRESR